MLLLAACDAAPIATVSAAPMAPEFWAWWGDGKAEVSSYSLTQPRYGALHEGTATLIFVTEDFSWSERVKADPGQHPPADIRPVLKLNATRDFVTGVYAYHVMTSVFSRVDGGDGMDALEPIKLTFSAQEWCGMVYDEWVMSSGSVRQSSATYFDSDTRAPADMAVPSDVLYGDAVPVLARGLRGEWLAPGESREFSYLPTALDLRFAHTAPAVGTAKVSRGATRTEREAPAGRFEVETWTVETGGVTSTWFVEALWPHRIIAWETSKGERAALRGSDRLPYWTMNQPSDQGARARVGL